MTAMLPALGHDSVSLADVLVSGSSAVLGRANPLGLAATPHVVVVLVDGLGAEALTRRLGHARHLSRQWDPAETIRTVFPSTTVAGLASLATGRLPGEHGLTEYRMFDAAHDRVLNGLTGWDERALPERWQRRSTVFQQAAEAGVRATAVGLERFRGSGFSRAVLRGADYAGAETMAARFDRAAEVIASASRSLTYLYVSELDQVGHARGCLSGEWVEALEELDDALGDFLTSLDGSVGVLLSADHGMLDVPATAHRLVEPSHALLEGVRHVAGEHRCVFLHLERGTDAGPVVEAWRGAYGECAWVCSRSELIEAGWFGAVVEDDAASRIGDVVVVPRDASAFYVGDDVHSSARDMVGQHGGVSDSERLIPLVRMGAFA